MRTVVKFTESIGKTIYVDANDVSAVSGQDGDYSAIYLRNGHKFAVKEKLPDTLAKLGLTDKPVAAVPEKAAQPPEEKKKA